MDDKFSFGYMLIALVALILGCFAFCKINQTSNDVDMSSLQVESIELIDSTEYKSHFESTIGIPTPTEMRYEYEMKLTDVEDTTIVRFTRKTKIEDISKFINELKHVN